jgi:hypothetical protein
MAITNAQQYQQLVNKPADGKRPGYRGDAAARSTGAAQSGRADPGSRGDPGEGRASRDSGVSRDTGGYAPSAFTGGDSASTGRYDEVSPQALQRAQQIIESQTKPQPKFLDQIINFINPAGKREQFYNLSRKIPGETKRSFKNLNDYRNYLVSQGTDLSTINRLMEGVDEETPIGFEQFEELAYDYEPKGITDIDKLREIFTDKTRGPFDKITAVPQNFSEFMLTQKNSPHLFTSGDIGNLMNMNRPKDLVNPKTGELYTNLEFETLKRNIGQDMGLTGRDGDQPILTPYQEDVVEDEVDPNSLAGMLANRGLAYRFMADGGRAGFMGGGMPYEGGIMDLESARQMYGLGKLVKKATGAIKKIVKSPVGKAALAFGAYKLGGGLLKDDAI